MHKSWHNSVWRNALTIFLSVVLALGGIPAVSVQADELEAEFELLEQAELHDLDEFGLKDDAGDVSADDAEGEQSEDDIVTLDDSSKDSRPGVDGVAPSADDAPTGSDDVAAVPDDAEAKTNDDKTESNDAATESDDGESGNASADQDEQLPQDQTDVSGNELNEEVLVEEDDEEQPLEETDDEESSEDLLFENGYLSEKIEVDEDHYYTVVVSFDEEACIPEGTKLRVSIPELDAAKKVRRQRAKRLRKILELEDTDRILGAKYLDIKLELDGKEVEPAAEVKVGIRTNDIRAARSAAVEVALGMEDKQGSETEQHIIPENRTKDKKGAHTRLAFPMQSLGRIALVTVVSKQDLWTVGGLDVSMLTPRYGLSVDVANTTAPSLDEGVDLLGCCSIQVDPAPAYGTVVWLSARPSDEGEDASSGVTAYRLRDGASNRTLFGSEGTTSPVAFRAGDTLLIVRDSGYRNTTLSMSDVTIEGMMPEGTQGEALDVTQNYEDPTALLRELDAEAAQEVEAGTREITTIAAYDITLEADGDEYQPDEEHPLTVAIANDAVDDALAEGKQVQVWHVANDEAVEVIEDYQLEDGVVTFQALGFSDYLLVAQAAIDGITEDVIEADALEDDEVSAQEDTSTLVTSSTFSVRASALTYARASLVTFVDTDKNPINGTVNGTIEITYTGGGTETTATNSIDMYSFMDKLDPAIADEYDFSRVYVQLKNDEKDFRRIMVGDNTAIGGSDAYPHRAYFHMNDVSENAPGHDYNGTWYQLNIGGKMDDVYIEFYHVAPASFRAIDTRNDPVEGAEFGLYTDSDCYTPFEYKDEEVTATSDKNGVVSFGKIPRGTYYMKETVIPEGYRKSTAIYTVVVDGETAIADVVHQDDDGSIIISDVLKMKLTKEWYDEEPHENESVEVAVYAQGEVVETVTLNAANNWTETLEGLDPNEAYMVSESRVTSGASDVTQSWIPTIEYEEKNPHVEYYKADEFKKGKQYVIITTTVSGTRALMGATSLVTTPLEVSADGSQITGTVTDGMIWNVDSLTQDGVIALRNEQSGKYLDHTQSARWFLNSSYPVPLYVRHSNTDGDIRFYHRANMNAAGAYYLYMWYSGAREGQVDRYMDDASKAGVFELYRKVNVRNVDVTITNKATEYPIRIKNVTYPQGEALPNMTFDLYRQEDYDATNPGTPLMSSLTANENGFLEHGAAGTDIKLIAGTYLLVQTSTLEEEGFNPLTKPLKFTITRGGALKVAQEDQEFTDFTYSTTMTEGETTVSVLQVPNDRSATLELTLDIQGNYADRTREFEFAITIPEGVSSLSGTLDGEPVEFAENNNTFVLKHGQTLRLDSVPAIETYVITQTDGRVAAVKQEGDGFYEVRAYAVPAADTHSTVTVAQDENDQRVITLSGLRGSADDPARVTITNTLANVDVPQTGLSDNASAWMLMVQLCACALVALFLHRLRSGLRKDRV